MSTRWTRWATGVVANMVPVAVSAGALMAVLTPAAAIAHRGNPHFVSVIRTVTPHPPGLRLDILGGDDRVQLSNQTGRTVTVYGYNDEPYARILGDGTVQVNHDSPAYYLNQDRYLQGVSVPAGVTGREAPQWTEVDKTGRFDWHDHRIHYMAKGTPPSVTNTAKRTRVFDWAVPLRIGSTEGAIHGRLFWRPLDGGGPPAGAVAALIALVLGGGALVAYRRRRAAPAQLGDAEPERGTDREAW